MCGALCRRLCECGLAVSLCVSEHVTRKHHHHQQQQQQHHRHQCHPFRLINLG
ncbi:GD17209 [Drosophila simulans]|uniref:GD17209 n=1 Tax=Drosophila simulans TaxID=7240 RepID=B4R575_DROSI|nr:GD17209 [Drosophila simulans]